MADTTDEANYYRRLNQIGEYKYNNRLDTVFIFQLTFIALLMFVALYYLSSVGIVSKIAVWIITMVLGVFLVIIYVNRLVVFGKMRDKNSWNRVNFGDDSITPSDYRNNGIAGGESGNRPTTNCRMANSNPIDPTEVCDPI
jgi:hypothetical protein